MGTTPKAKPESLCPKCQSPMEHWPALNADGFLAVCPHCRPKPSADELDEFAADLEAQLTGQAETPSRLRNLLRQPVESLQSSPLPASLLKTLPAEARRLLSQVKARKAEPSAQESPAGGSVSPEPQPQAEGPPPQKAPSGQHTPEGKTQPTREVDKERSAPARPVAERQSKEQAFVGGVTPEDVALLATELEDGVSVTRNRRRCPECDAIISIQRSQCPWCETIVSN